MIPNERMKLSQDESTSTEVWTCQCFPCPFQRQDVSTELFAWLNDCGLLIVGVKPIEHRRSRQFSDTIHFA